MHWFLGLCLLTSMTLSISSTLVISRRKRKYKLSMTWQEGDRNVNTGYTYSVTDEMSHALNSWRIPFINCWNVSDASRNPDVIQMNLNDPNDVNTVILSMPADELVFDNAPSLEKTTCHRCYLIVMPIV